MQRQTEYQKSLFCNQGGTYDMQIRQKLKRSIFFQCHKIFYYIYYLHDKVVDLILDIFSSKLLHGSLDRSFKNDFSRPWETGQEIPSHGSHPRWKKSITRLYPKQSESCLHYLNNICFNTIPPSTARFSKWSLLFGFSNWNIFFYFPYSPATCSAHLILLD